MSLHPCVNHVTLDNEGRPYGPAPGLVVGAGFMSAQKLVPIPAKVRWFLRRRGALYMRPCPAPATTGARNQRGPVMAACGHAFGGNLAKIANLLGRI